MVGRRPGGWRLLLVVIIVAAVLRIPLAMRPGLWADEIFSLAMATGHSLEHPASLADSTLGDFVEPAQAQPAAVFNRYLRHEAPPAGAARVVRAVLLSDTNPPLYYLLLNLWTRAAGTGDAALRLFSVLWALASLPLLWLVGRELGGRRAAWTACVLFAFAPPALYYSAEGRMYSLLWFLGLALAWCTLALAKHGPRPVLLACWSLAGAAGLLTHYFFAFTWLACSAWLWFHPGRLRRASLVAVAAATGLLVLPWYLQIPDSLGRWRITGPWLANPLSWDQALAAPLQLAWSLVSGRGIWGGSAWADRVAAGMWLLVAFLILRRRPWRLLGRRQRLAWLWALGAVLGPVVFDLLRHSNASMVARYALSGLPAATLLAAVAIGLLPGVVRTAFLLLFLLVWLPGIRGVFATPARPWEPYPDVSARLAARAEPPDLIIVHSIPSGVLGVARYLAIDTPLTSWVVQLGQRRVPEDMHALLAGSCKVALVKVHDLGEPSPAEAWLRGQARLDGRETLFRFADVITEVRYYHLEIRDGRSGTRCRVSSRSAPNDLGTPTPSAQRSAE